MNEFETRTMKIMVVKKGEPLFSATATVVEICDEAAGEYVEVSQEGRDDGGKIAIDPEEWSDLREAINKMVDLCRSDETKGNQ